MTELEELKQKIVMEARFNNLRGNYRSSILKDDKIGLKNVQHETNAHLNEFIEAGFDANELCLMLSPESLLRNFDQLIKHGAKVTTDDLLNQATSKFVKENWNWFLRHGVKAETLAFFCYGETADPCDIEELLQKEWVDTDLAFKVAKETIFSKDIEADLYYDLFEILYRNNFTCAEKWINSLPKDGGSYAIILRRIVTDADEWEAIGINPEHYYDEWVKMYADEFLGELDHLPYCIPPEKLLKNVSATQWLESYDQVMDAILDFEEFVLEKDGDPELVCKLIEKLVEVMDVSKLAKGKRKYLYQKLLSYDVPEYVLDKLRI